MNGAQADRGRIRESFVALPPFLEVVDAHVVPHCDPYGTLLLRFDVVCCGHCTVHRQAKLKYLEGGSINCEPEAIKILLGYDASRCCTLLRISAQHKTYSVFEGQPRIVERKIP
jgi:hypothetical protein